MRIPYESENVGEALLELLAARGVEYFIGGGAGTDFPPIIEAFAKREALGLPVPKPVTAVHEITAVAMAHGYTMVSGKVPFTMVHSSVGTANAVCGVINAERVRIPLFLAAGRTSLTEHGMHGSRTHGVHWAQETYDQAGMVREFVKWDFELRLATQLETVIDRGFALAQSGPPAPVYLSLPLEVLDLPMTGLSYSAQPRLRPAGTSMAGPSEIEQAARILVEANNPLIITTGVGRDPGAVAPFIEFVDTLAIPVIETWGTHMNFPQDHPMHLGYDFAALIGEADVVVVIEADAPWFPTRAAPAESATIIHIDEDPLYHNYPYRGFATDLSLTGTPRHTLAALTAAINVLQPDRERIARRHQHVRATHEQQRTGWQQEAEKVSGKSPLDSRWISRCIGQQLTGDEIVITEFILDPTQTCFNAPGSYFNHSHAGGLGWSPGAALGAKLARPDASVICAIGDGTYTFGAPVAAHHTAAINDLPVLFIIYNNAGWERTRLATRSYAADGYVTRTDKVPLCELEPAPHYHKICEAAGGYGEQVDDPAELPAAIKRGLHAVKTERRQALINVITSKAKVAGN